MCVTNTTSRRTQQPVSLGVAAAAGSVNLADALKQSLVSPYASTSVPKPYGSFPTFATAAAAQPAQQQYLIPRPAEKPRPKRRRKPQKPGKTAKLNDRHFVHHDYHDHSHDAVEKEASSGERRKGGVSIAFPVKLHSVLDQVEADGLAHIISWQPHGRCFVIHKPKEFVDHVMPKYFRQTKLTSFQRQLNLYGFSRLTRGPDATGYYHELFLRGKVFLCKKMIRTKVKGTKFKAASSPDQEPDFYTMPPLVPTVTSDEDMSHGSDPSHMTLQQPAAAPAPMNPFEPIPYDYNPMSRFVAAQAVPPVASAAAGYADRVLDEAVEELFMDIPNDTSDPLDDFVQDWVPADTAFAQSLENDAALGFMLEKLLEE